MIGRDDLDAIRARWLAKETDPSDVAAVLYPRPADPGEAMIPKTIEELDEARREVADRVARRNRPEDDERLDEIERAIVARVRWERLS